MTNAEYQEKEGGIFQDLLYSYEGIATENQLVKYWEYTVENL